MAYGVEAETTTITQTLDTLAHHRENEALEVSQFAIEVICVRHEGRVHQNFRCWVSLPLGEMGYFFRDFFQ
jgi:hypothetical protein